MNYQDEEDYPAHHQVPMIQCNYEMQYPLHSHRSSIDMQFPPSNSRKSSIVTLGQNISGQMSLRQSAATSGTGTGHSSNNPYPGFRQAN